MSETDLIARARKNDPSAWEVIVREHEQAAFRFAYLITGNPAEAEDAAME